MTYDQWKTTDPRDAEPEQEAEPINELEIVYNRLLEVQSDAEHAQEVAAKRIADLTDALEEALEYFNDRYDVIDGDDGKPRQNTEMRIGQMIHETLYGIPF